MSNNNNGSSVPTMSSDFFNNFDAKPTKPVVAPVKKAPPPPPVGAGAATTTATRPTASSSNPQQQQQARPPPPQGKPGAAGAAVTVKRPSRGAVAGGATSSATTTTSSMRRPPGTMAAATAAASRTAAAASAPAAAAATASSNPYSRGTNVVNSKQARPATNPSYYSTAAAQPTLQQQQQQQPNAFYAGPTDSQASNDFDSDWFSVGGNTPASANPGMTSENMHYANTTAAPSRSNPGLPMQQQQQQFQYTQMPMQPSYTSTPSLEGSMDTSTSTASTAPTQPSYFMPTATFAGSDPGMISQSTSAEDDSHNFENEPPLLEELGVNLEHIWLKTKAVVLPSQRFAGHSATALLDPAIIVEDADLAGPLAFALLLGGELLLTGKIHFGYIYGFGLFGCMSMTLILNLLSPSQAVSIWTVTSILGYSLLPVNILAAVKIIVVNVAQLSTLGQWLGILAVIWSTVASTRLFEVGCGMRHQRYLIAYPIGMLYSAFVLITIF